MRAAMSTSTRLIVLLLLMVGAVMTAGGVVLLRQRVGVLETATRNEARAHAFTLQAALEASYEAGRFDEVQILIDRLSEYPKIFSVIVFDERGEAMLLSDPLAAEVVRQPPEVGWVLATGESVETVRRIGDEEVFTIIGPLALGQGRRGAYEVAQPRAIIEADMVRARRSIALITLALFAAISICVLAVARRNLAGPIGELVVGAEALGEGDLGYRVLVPRGGSELVRLARAFNRMADRLNDQRLRAARDTEERLMLARELRQHERLASLGTLAAGVAHEMGAPLNVIRGRAEQLLARIEDNGSPARDKLQRNLTIITEQADAIARIVRELLDLARPLDLQPEKVTVAQLMERAADMLEADAARAGVLIDVAASGKLSVDVDAAMIHQVLVNICLNGIQAMELGGRLRLEAIEHETHRDGRAFVGVAITDTGPGVAPEHMEQIFDPFFTTKEVGAGTGLGLTVSRRIVEEHGGWIAVAAGPAGGASFSVYLPKDQGESGG